MNFWRFFQTNSFLKNKDLLFYVLIHLLSLTSTDAYVLCWILGYYAREEPLLTWSAHRKYDDLKEVNNQLLIREEKGFGNR